MVKLVLFLAMLHSFEHSPALASAKTATISASGEPELSPSTPKIVRSEVRPIAAHREVNAPDEETSSSSLSASGAVQEEETPAGTRSGAEVPWQAELEMNRSAVGDLWEVHPGTGKVWTAAKHKVGTVGTQNWPAGFCMETNIIIPAATTHSYRAIAMIGGIGTCGNFMMFLHKGNHFGFGVQCNANILTTAKNFPAGKYSLTFCKNRGRVLIEVDGKLEAISETLGDKWYFKRSGDVSVLVGSHTESKESLSGASLKSILIRPLTGRE